MEWKNPPGHSRGLVVEAAELRRNPGRWGMIPYEDKDKGRKHRERIVNGKGAAFRPQGSFEATLRYLKDGCELYLRYIGKEEEHGEPATGALHWTGMGPEGGAADPQADGRAGSAVDLPGSLAPDRGGDR